MQLDVVYPIMPAAVSGIGRPEIEAKVDCLYDKTGNHI